jgi:hypothetical protein
MALRIKLNFLFKHNQELISSVILQTRKTSAFTNPFHGMESELHNSVLKIISVFSCFPHIKLSPTSVSISA